MIACSQTTVNTEENSKQLQPNEKIVVVPPVELIPINPNATAKDLERLKSTKRVVNTKENKSLNTSPSKNTEPQIDTLKNSESKKVTK